MLCWWLEDIPSMRAGSWLKNYLTYMPHTLAVRQTLKAERLSPPPLRPAHREVSMLVKACETI
jgi:hypothetical protein